MELPLTNRGRLEENKEQTRVAMKNEKALEGENIEFGENFGRDSCFLEETELLSRFYLSSSIAKKYGCALDSLLFCSGTLRF